MVKLAQPPTVTAGNFRAVSLYETPVGSDEFLYAALIDTTNQKVWVYKYGGYAGVSNWYGPVDVDTASTDKCQEAKGIIPIRLAPNKALQPTAQPLPQPDGG